MPNWVVKILCLAFVVALAGCGDRKKTEAKPNPPKPETPIADGLTPEQAAKVVAKVGDQEITVGDVTEQINRLSPYIKRRWATPEKRKEFLQKLIQIELLSQEAIRNGLDNSPEVQRAVKQVMVRLMVKNDFEKELFPTSVDEKRLKEEYEKKWLKYHTPAQHRISQIVVATEAEALAFIKEIQGAESVRGRFRELARTVSIDEDSKNRAGDVGYVTNPADIESSKADGESHTFVQAEGVSDLVAAAAWKLKAPNELFPAPVKTEQGYHIIMLTTTKPALNRSFNSVKRLIENRVLRELKKEKMDEFVAKLRKDAKIKIFQENLDNIELDLTPESDSDGLSASSETNSDTDVETTASVEPTAPVKKK
ncbi:MAG: peptidylprolyl isomerase [Deltaproteobacteria bacterium]|nr:peptidylprolyl isomerase [Deltaproteobacteria bacterium]MBN2673902.1 peptidylprolyl isomerase [Deltaproteobacteria bacterium]